MTLHYLSDCAAVRYGDPDRLIVMFSSVMAVATREFDYRAYSRQLPYTVLFVREKNPRDGYNQGITGLTSTVEETAEFLDYFVKRMDVKRVSMFGTSLGGYAATLFSHLVGADDLHVIGPVSYMDPEVRDKLGGGERVEGLMNHVANRYHMRGEEPRYLDTRRVILENPGKVKVARMYYSPDDEIDQLQIGHISDIPHIQAIPCPGTTHRFLGAKLTRDGTLTRDFETSIEDLIAGPPAEEVA